MSSRWAYNAVMDDERDFSNRDPAKLLPFTCFLEQSNPDIEKLPGQYVGSGDDLYAGNAVF
jgi:hypothetical protein